MELYVFILFIVIAISIIGCLYMIYNFYKVKSYGEGTPEMIKIAKLIREGANTFLMEEYKVLLPIIAIIAIILAIFIQVSSAVSFVIGLLLSLLAGLIGMRSATYANVRTTNRARKTNSIRKTNLLAIRGGSIMGISVPSFAHFGIAIVCLIFLTQLYNLVDVSNWIGISFVSISMTLSSYSFGSSIVALFNRVGGGIYTKAADMGADLVGKTELNLPEDDHRNPAVIADNVGDNAGDVCGMGSDIFESYVGSLTSSMIFIVSQYMRYKALGLEFSNSLFLKLFAYPVLFGSMGIIACIIGLTIVFNVKISSDPKLCVDSATWIAAGITAILNLAMTMSLFHNEITGDLPFRFGIISPFISALFGLIAGIALGFISEYYTSNSYKPTLDVVEACKTGPALAALVGMANGKMSTWPSLIVLSFATLFSFISSGLYGISMAAIGMLSFVAMTVTIDTYGPICDNAGGIAEMCNLNENVRKITDRLDSIGNTTAAMGKGFAIGSASFTTVALMTSYLYIYTSITEEVTLNMINIFTLSGGLVGVGVPFFFSGMLSNSVGKAAEKMVEEVRRQFREIPGIADNTNEPEYNRCISISTKGALSEMKVPVFIAIFVPVLSGFVFGPDFVAGLLFTSTMVGIPLAIYFGNTGGSWDNAKKYLEENGMKGTAEHIASVICDTIGDPFKDTDGPSIDILMKMMCVISIILVSIFSKYNLVVFLSTIF